MSKLKLIALLLLAASLAFMTSCSDDDGDNPTGGTTTYFDFGVGSSWEYESFQYDEDGNADVESRYTYTMNYDRNETKEGRTAAVFVDNDGGEESENFFHFSGSVMSMLAQEVIPSDIGEDVGAGELDIPSGWLAFIDYNGSSWDIANVPIEEEDVELGQGLSGTLSGNLVVRGVREGTESITVGGQTYNAVKFKLTFGMDAEIAAGFFTVPLEFTIENYQYWVPNVGMLKSDQPNQTISISFAGQSMDQPIPGFVDNCISINLQ